MDKSHRRWLEVNRKTLLEENVPLMRIVDLLITRGVYDPNQDDYQQICAESTERGKLRALLDSLATKSSDSAFEHFKQALLEVAPKALPLCIDPPNALKELDDATRSSYRRNLKVRPLAWLSGVKPVDPSTFFLNLSTVDKTEAERMMNDYASSSAKEIERQEYHYSFPTEQNLVRLDSLFPKWQTEHTNEQALPENGNDGLEPLAKRPYGADAKPCSVSPVAGRNAGDYPARVLETAQRVSIYGGAGCGKTSCLMKAASMYAEGQLWQGAHAFLLWKLRDPSVQDAETLKELLRELKLGLTDVKSKEFADVLQASEGEGVILALDGVDELDAKKKGYVRRLLKGDALSKACVLATSRSCSTAKTYFNKYCVNLELLGFTEEQVDQFIEQQLGDKPDLGSNLQRVLLENPTLASLMLVPLLATMVCQVFQLTGEEPPKTRTALYSKLVTLVLKRTVEESEGRVTLSGDDMDDTMMVSGVCELLGQPKDLLLELARVAFLAHEDGKVVFDHLFMRDTAKCSNKALKLGLLSRYDVEVGTAIMPQYSFQHLTVQEFLVAYHRVVKSTTEQEVRNEVSRLVKDRHNHVVLQFFAGLLKEDLHCHFFAHLNELVHDGYSDKKEESRVRLRLSLQCAKEACGENVNDFPSALQLPTHVTLLNTTAADLAQLPPALEKSHQTKGLYLYFDVLKAESKSPKLNRVITQTRRAITKVMAAVKVNKLIHNLRLYGPKSYGLFNAEGWRSLVEIVKNDTLEKLNLERFELDNETFGLLSDALCHNKRLKELRVRSTGLNDTNVRTLAKCLQSNSTLQHLDIHRNSYGDATRLYLKQHLHHIQTVKV